MGFIAHCSQLRCSLQPVAWTIAAGFMKPIISSLASLLL